MLTLQDLGLDNYELMLAPIRCDCGCGKYKALSCDVEEEEILEEAVGGLLFRAIEYAADKWDACRSYGMAIMKDGTIITTYLPDKDKVTVERYLATLEENLEAVKENIASQGTVSLMVLQDITLSHDTTDYPSADFRIVSFNIYEKAN